MFRYAVTGTRFALQFAVICCALVVGACSGPTPTAETQTEVIPKVTTPNASNSNGDSKITKSPAASTEQGYLPSISTYIDVELLRLDVPSIITIRAQIRPGYSLLRHQGPDFDYTNLTGILDIQSVEPDISDTLQIMTAGSHNIVVPHLGSCELTMTNFSSSVTTVSVTPKRQIGFFFSGIENQTPMDECFVKLATMSMAGFITEFENVRLGAVHSTMVVPKVRLEVSPHIESM